MPIFISKKNKKEYSLSRMPHGNLTVGSYIIRPYTSELKQILDLHLEELLKTNPKCVDSQNGNALDNIIDSWAERAKKGLKKQQAIHKERIKDLAVDMKANLQNANDWLVTDRQELSKLCSELEDLEKEAERYNKEMMYW